MTPEDEQVSIARDDRLGSCGNRCSEHLIVIGIARNCRYVLGHDHLSQGFDLAPGHPHELGWEAEPVDQDPLELVERCRARDEVQLTSDRAFEKGSREATEQDAGDKDVRVEQDAHYRL